MFGRTAWRVGRILGIDLRIDASWLLVAALISYVFFLQYSQVFTHLRAPGIVALALASAFLFFSSVLVHELAHAVVARRRRIEVEGITLFLFGGATHARVESKGPIDELIVAAVGPLTSLGLAGLFWGARLLLPDAIPIEIILALGFLGWLNLVLAVFNLLPGFPLDGGRILRALIWRATGNLALATRVAGVGGQAVGYLMMAGGGVMALTGRPGGGIWLAAIGWFLSRGARAAHEEQRSRTLLERVEAGDVMRPALEQGDAAGPEAPPDTPVVQRRTPVTEVLTRLRHRDVHRVLVVEDHRVVGVITAPHLGTWLAEHGLTPM
jgi:Zn-dependent protease